MAAKNGSKCECYLCSVGTLGDLEEYMDTELVHYLKEKRCPIKIVKAFNRRTYWSLDYWWNGNISSNRKWLMDGAITMGHSELFRILYWNQGWNEEFGHADDYDRSYLHNERAKVLAMDSLDLDLLNYISLNTHLKIYSDSSLGCSNCMQEVLLKRNNHQHYLTVTKQILAGDSCDVTSIPMMTCMEEILHRAADDKTSQDLECKTRLEFLALVFTFLLTHGADCSLPKLQYFYPVLSKRGCREACSPDVISLVVQPLLNSLTRSTYNGFIDGWKRTLRNAREHAQCDLLFLDDRFLVCRSLQSDCRAVALKAVGRNVELFKKLNLPWALRQYLKTISIE